MVNTDFVSRYQKWNTIKEYKEIVGYVEGKLVIYSSFNSKEKYVRVIPTAFSKEIQCTLSLGLIKEESSEESGSNRSN